MKGSSLTVNKIPVHRGVLSLFKCNAADIQVCAFLSPVLNSSVLNACTGSITGFLLKQSFMFKFSVRQFFVFVFCLCFVHSFLNFHLHMV